MEVNNNRQCDHKHSSEIIVDNASNPNDQNGKIKQNGREKISRIHDNILSPFNEYGIEIPLLSYYKDLSLRFKDTKHVFKYFCLCLQTPRPSEYPDKIREAVIDVAKKLQVDYEVDDVGNVILRKKPSKGYENNKGVTLQCHLDMVATKRSDIQHEFLKDGIKAYIDDQEEWIKATGTTLGADNGIGVALALALLEDKNLEHGLIEVALTIEEESTFRGAYELGIINRKKDLNYFKTNALINIDNVVSEKICVGSAGGMEKYIDIQVEYTTIYEYMTNEYTGYHINVDKLHGGHSGIDINSGFGNATVLMVRLLNFVASEHNISFSIISLNGGNAINAIPSSCQCQVILLKKFSEQFELLLNNYWKEYIWEEYKFTEKTMTLTIKTFDIHTLLNNDKSINNENTNHETDKNQNKNSNKIQISTTTFTKHLLSALMLIPHGMIRMHPAIPDSILTSICFSLLKFNINDSLIKISLFARSSSINEMKELNRKIDCLLEMCRDNLNIKKCKMEGLYKGWDFENSVLLQCSQQAYFSLFNKECDVFTMHAGLETGIIKDNYPHFEVIAIGPEIKNPHSVDERLNIKSVSVAYRWLFEIVALLSQLPK